MNQLHNNITQHRRLQYLLFFITLLITSGCTQAPVTIETPTSSAPTVEDPSPSKQTIGETYQLPILGLHHVGPAPAHLSQSAKQWYISEEKFKEILQIIQDKNYTPITATQLAVGLEKGTLPPDPIMITFDDGAIDFYTVAFPILKQHNIPVTLHIMTGVGGKNYVNKEQIKEMHNSGLIDIQSHTKYHAYLTRISPQERAPEIKASKQYIEELLDKPVVALAYPFGLYNEEVIEEVKDAGYQIAFTINQGNTQQRDKPLELNRTLIVEYTNIEKLLQKENPHPEG